VSIELDDTAIRKAITEIETQGPCALCGGKYAAHRLIDAEQASFRYGTALAEIDGDYRGQGVPQMLARWIALSLLQASEE